MDISLPDDRDSSKECIRNRQRQNKDGSVVGKPIYDLLVIKA